jgi:hypothetical protein
MLRQRGVFTNNPALFDSGSSSSLWKDAIYSRWVSVALLKPMPVTLCSCFASSTMLRSLRFQFAILAWWWGKQTLFKGKYYDCW